MPGPADSALFSKEELESMLVFKGVNTEQGSLLLPVLSAIPMATNIQTRLVAQSWPTQFDGAVIMVGAPLTYGFAAILDPSARTPSLVANWVWLQTTVDNGMPLKQGSGPVIYCISDQVPPDTADLFRSRGA